MSPIVPLLLTGFLFVATTSPSVAQDQTFPATIVAGDCESDTVVAELTELVLPTGADIGAESGRTAASSFTTVPVAFEQLTATDHAVQAIERCGAIGGSLNAAGALIVVLSGADGDRGIAYLIPNPIDPRQTDLSLFVSPPDSPQDNVGTNEAPEEAYLEAVGDNLEVMQASLTRFSDLFINNRLDDPTWYTELKAQLAIMDEQYRLLNDLAPPPTLTEVHQTLLEGYSLIVLAGDDAERGLNTPDPSAFDAGILKFQQAKVVMERANDLIEEFRRERGS